MLMLTRGRKGNYPKRIGGWASFCQIVLNTSQSGVTYRSPT